MSIRSKYTVLLCCMILTVLLIGGYTWARKTVILTVDGQEVSLVTFRSTTAAVLDQQGVTLGEKDRVDPRPETRLTDGMRIVVTRAIPIQLAADQAVTELWTAAATVGEALAETGINLGVLDRCEPSLSTAVTPGMTLKVVRVTEAIETRGEAIPFPTVRQNDSTLEAGVTQVRQDGQAGRAEIVSRVVYADGVEQQRETVERKILQAAVPRILAVGTVNTLSRGGSSFRFSKVLEMSATAYYPDPAWSSGFTYLGMPAERGIVAVDPKVIPLRTRLYIEGYGFAIAGDIGSAIKGNRIDLCYATLAEAMNWGRRNVKVYIIAD